MKEGKVINKSICENLKIYEKMKEDNFDLVLRKIKILESESIILYIDSLCNKDIINRDILRPILTKVEYHKSIANKNILTCISERLIATGKVEEINTQEQVMEKILNGFMVILVEGYDRALSMEVIGGPVRAIEQPQLGGSFYASADAFTENIQTNITLIRRKLKDKNLKVKSIKIDKGDNRIVSLLYIEDEKTKEMSQVINNKIIENSNNKYINLNDISKAIENRNISLFPIGQYIERPDKACVQLKRGKIGIICEESQGILIYPSKFIDFFIMSDDYYNSKVFKYLIWILRYICFWISILLPAIYIATISFNPEILPPGLATNIGKSISMVPFPDIYEVFFITFLVMIIKEASVNLPQKLGTMVGIVGGIILGQSLIASSMVSAPVIILITCSTIAQFVVPNYRLINTAQILTIFVTILGSTLGLFGVVLGVFVILIHLNRLEYLGMDYMSIKNN